ncbi:hypothetical protein MSG28_008772 [Choristoneura fumiferana]|uniref:Uncharacterized protein n=1 Tax=Choristoneura fumiferana TaxID=7141 RepID=A0ACC0J7Y6_CHOFU|nr:hypothetical protein MSG28_008772 [Choristoneura fumiferana]
MHAKATYELWRELCSGFGNEEIRRRTKVSDIAKRISSPIARTTDGRWGRKVLEWRPRIGKRSVDCPPKKWTDTGSWSCVRLPPPPPPQPPRAAADPLPCCSYDVFTELDPLGTGRSKPYVDKKLFFQELKNPPKKVLKDLVPTQLLTDIPAEKPGDYQATMTSLSRQSGGTVSIGRPLCPGHFFATVDPFEETDPFDSTDPFSESFKDDPFTSMQEFPKAPRDAGAVLREEVKRKLTREDRGEGEGRNVFNGPLQVTLPPEPVPKSPRLQRQNTTDTSAIRQRPQPSSKLSVDNASPPPPLPPKKISELAIARPPPRPPQPDDEGPPLPRPVRKKEPLADRSMKPRLSSAATTSSEDEYLSPAPPPLPAARRFDITLSQLLTCSMDELAHRLRVPAATLSSMTLPQLTDYLRSYLAADNDRAHIHVEPSMKPEKDRPSFTIPISTAVTDKPPPTAPSKPKDFKPQFEDNFAPTEVSDTFVANFDDFDKKANTTYDRYAAFREIQEQELKEKSILDPIDDKSVESEPKQDSDEKEELAAINDIMRTNQEREDIKENNRSPLKTLDELTLDSFNMFRKSVSPKPTQIDLKIEDIKSVMKNLQLEQSRRSVSPRENNNEVKTENTNDRYAALREITITEPQDEFESIPPEAPKERKRSDEKSDGFDNSDFFDCIDNSSLSFSHVDDAFRKSPVVKEKEEVKVEEKKETPAELAPARDLQPPARLSAGSISDVASGSSPDTKEKCVSPRGTTRAGRWAVLGAGASPWSSDSRDSEPRHAWREGRRRRHHSPAAPRSNTVQTSSSSRDVSPWEEEPPPSRLQRPPSHHRDRESRHNSSGSRECLDSGSGREKDKLRDKRDSRDRDRDVSRDGRESRRDSGSGRDRRDVSKDRDHRDHRRDRRSRDREKDTWDRDRTYSRERDYRDSRSRERPAMDYREKERDRHRKPRHSYDEEEE